MRGRPLVILLPLKTTSLVCMLIWRLRLGLPLVMVKVRGRNFPPRPPNPPAQRLLVYDGMEWQRGHALAFPVYYAPDHVTYSVPPPNPNYPLVLCISQILMLVSVMSFTNANQYAFPSTVVWMLCLNRLLILTFMLFLKLLLILVFVPVLMMPLMAIMITMKIWMG